mmetsp:Transcript_115435/g.199564  ORF Transcript_115435/g.199564 Transcript_115435/m.199564 type:complete len:89 (+) Transcript_115435:895-1161(+)
MVRVFLRSRHANPTVPTGRLKRSMPETLSGESIPSTREVRGFKWLVQRLDHRLDHSPASRESSALLWNAVAMSLKHVKNMRRLSTTNV